MNSSLQAFAEAINLKENLKNIGIFPQPKKTKEQVEAERQVIHKKKPLITNNFNLPRSSLANYSKVGERELPLFPLQITGNLTLWR